MWVEGNNDRFAVYFPGFLYQGGNNFLMTKMNAIKGADGDNGISK
jgi:hypothetical protein